MAHFAMPLRKRLHAAVLLFTLFLTLLAQPLQASVARGQKGAVSSAEKNATEAGIEILKAGGNAIDASIAVAFALAVTHPSAGNIGGGGFLVYRDAKGSHTCVDYREVAPSASTRNMYLDEKGDLTNKSLLGPLAAGIPGTVAGMALVHKKYGSLPWDQLIAPAIRLAEEGHVIDSWHARTMNNAAKTMERAQIKSSIAIFRKADGTAYKEGDLWVQPDLARTLKLIARRGPKAFYEGSFAQKMAATVRELGGIWTSEDLADYEAIEREPIVLSYHGHEIISMPPPSAGGVVMGQILKSCAFLKVNENSWQSPMDIHLYAEACRRSYIDRNMLLGDPEFVANPVADLLADKYILRRIASVTRCHASRSEDLHKGIAQKESEQTTHFSVVDKWGNAVSNTYTLNTGFGSKVVVPGTGILLNNEMDDFSAKPGHPNKYGLVQGVRNAIEPGKRMLSSMTPSIVLKDGKLRAVLGSPGGSTITTTVVQLARALIDYDKSLEEAVNAPRYHHQWLPDTVFVEPHADKKLVRQLEGMGHKVTLRKYIGHANCIEVDMKNGERTAVADVLRNGGHAAAY